MTGDMLPFYIGIKMHILFSTPEILHAQNKLSYCCKSKDYLGFPTPS